MFRILLATDFSEASVNAYRYCIAFAREERITMYVAHIYQHGAHSHLSTRNLELFYKKEYDNFLTRTRRFSQMYPNLIDQQVVMRSAVEARVTEGRVSNELIDIGQAYTVDMIAIGSKENPGLFRRVFGHLSRKLIFETPIPLIIIPESYIMGSPGKIAMLSLEPEDELVMADWIDAVGVLKDTDRINCLVPSSANLSPEVEPGKYDERIVRLASPHFSDIHDQLVDSRFDLVMLTLRNGHSGPEKTYRNDLVHYLYDHLKIPLICLHG